MTEKYPSKDEIERLTEHYEQLGDEDVLVEWERGEPVTIDVGEPMVSRSVHFPRQHLTQACSHSGCRLHQRGHE
jgi:hypothetical protein